MDKNEKLIKKLKKYQPHYEEDKFWEKMKAFLKKAGRELLERALRLYYCSKDENTPLWVKNLIIAGLGYFILPLDLVPDVLPIVGLADDLSVLGMVISAVSAYLKDEHLKQAEDKIHNLFDNEKNS